MMTCRVHYLFLRTPSRHAGVVYAGSEEEGKVTEQTLRNVLRIDLIGSAVSVVVVFAGAGLLADWLDVSPWVLVILGLVLVPWVYHLYRTERRQQLRTGEVAVIVVGNIGWAVAAAVLIFGFPDALSTAGKWIVGVFSLAVLDLGVAQWLGLRGKSPTGPQAA